MGLKIISQTLAPLLEQEESEVARWIETVCTAGMEMFAAEGRLGITGLGLLQRQHLAPSIAEGVGGQIYLAPPRDTVQFQTRRIGLDDDFLYQTAQRELGLSEEQASRFAYGVEKAIVKLLDTKGVAELGDLGVFTRTGQAKSLQTPAAASASGDTENAPAAAPDGGVKTTFEPSDALLGFLNSRYLHLEPVTLHDVNASVPGATAQPKPLAKSPAPVAKPLPVPKPEVPVAPEPELITGPPETPADYPFPVAEKKIQSSAATATQSASSTFQPILPPPVESDPLPSMDIADLESESDDDERDEQRRRMLITLVVSLTVLAVIALGFLLVNTFSPSVSTTVKPSAVATQPAEPATAKPAEPAAAKPVEPKTVEPKASVDPKASEPEAIEPKRPDPKAAAVTPSETKPVPVEKPAPPVAKPAEKPVEKVAEKPATPVPSKPAGTAAVGLPAELTVPVEPSKGGSCIVVGSGESRKESEMIAAPYIAKGLAVSFATAEVGGGTRHRVRIGQFASTAAASKAIKEYASLFPKGAFVVRVK